MSKKLLGTIPIGMDLTDGYVLQFTTVDSTTGDLVSGVTVSNVALLVDNLGGGDLTSGFEDIEPLFTPLPAGDV